VPSCQVSQFQRPPQFTNGWARGSPWVEEQQTRNGQNCIDHHKSAHQTTNCTCKAKKSGGTRPKKFFPAGAPPPTFKFVPAPLVTSAIKMSHNDTSHLTGTIYRKSGKERLKRWVFRPNSVGTVQTWRDVVVCSRQERQRPGKLGRRQSTTVYDGRSADDDDADRRRTGATINSRQYFKDSLNRN